MPREMRPERPMDAARWLGAGFGLGVMVLVALALIWIVVSGVGKGRWVWSPTPRSSTAPAVATTPRETPLPTDTPTPEPSPSPTAGAGQGTIKGTLEDPTGSDAAQTVCAALASNQNTKYCVTRAAGSDLSYAINAPAGTYYVYASLQRPESGYPVAYQAYYNQYVTCKTAGTASCPTNLHVAYIPVTVKVGQTVSGIAATDWDNVHQ